MNEIQESTKILFTMNERQQKDALLVLRFMKWRRTRQGMSFPELIRGAWHYWQFRFYQWLGAA